MPAFDCRIDHGNFASGTGCDPVDEPGVLVNSLTIAAAREKKLVKGADSCTHGIRFQDPTLTFSFDGYISSTGADDLSNLHPGTAVASLANFNEVIHGFDPTDGVMVIEDPSRQLSSEEICKTTFSIVQYPMVN